MKKTQKVQKYKNKNKTWVPAISTKKQNRVKQQKYNTAKYKNAKM